MVFSVYKFLWKAMTKGNTDWRAAVIKTRFSASLFIDIKNDFGVFPHSSGWR
jgi:hypothetical protein